jgi:hypothetical protein
MQAFRTAGPYNLKGSGDKNLTYAQAMTARDLTGSNQSERYLFERLGIPLPDGDVDWWSFLSPIRACLEAVTKGQVESYRQLFEIVR